MNRRDFILQGSMAAATAMSARTLGASVPAGAPLRVAQIGTAHTHAAGKWETLRRRSDFFSPLGIWEPDPEQRRAVADKADYAGARWLSETEFFALPNLEAVLVETELPELLGVGRRCLEAGWHLHLDKPAGTDLKAFAALQALAAEKHRTLQLGYMYRYHPAFQFCFEAVQQGWLGELFAVHGDMGKVIAPGRRAWLAKNYGGSMMLLGCHLLDLTIALLGKPAKTTAFRRRTFPEKDAYYDNEMAVLEYPKALATIRSLLAEVEGDDRRQFVLCGDRGTIEILPLEPARLRLALKQPAGGYKAGYQEISLPEITGRYDDLLVDFAGMVAGRPSRLPRFTPAHDLLVQQTLLEVGRVS